MKPSQKVNLLCGLTLLPALTALANLVADVLTGTVPSLGQLVIGIATAAVAYGIYRGSRAARLVVGWYYALGIPLAIAVVIYSWTELDPLSLGVIAVMAAIGLVVVWLALFSGDVKQAMSIRSGRPAPGAMS